MGNNLVYLGFKLQRVDTWMPCYYAYCAAVLETKLSCVHFLALVCIMADSSAEESDTASDSEQQRAAASDAFTKYLLDSKRSGKLPAEELQAHMEASLESLGWAQGRAVATTPDTLTQY
eukprot:3898558-Amphidinium_carterae.2